MFLSLVCGGSAKPQESDIVREFRSVKPGNQDYSSVQTVRLRKEILVLALWHPHNTALELHADIYSYVVENGKASFVKAYTGDLSEEIIEIVSVEVAGANHPQLAILCRSGQIKILRILEKKERTFSLVFENGGTDVTVVKESKEIWLKSDSARQIDIYRWSEAQNHYMKTKTLDIFF